MAVKIRLKKLGRRHRPYFRICVMDSRTPRDGKAIEEIGTYDPMIPDTDKRVTMKSDRVDYWLGVGAQPTEKVNILIKKYKGNVPEVREDQRVQRAPASVAASVAEKAKKDAEEAKVAKAEADAKAAEEAKKAAEAPAPEPEKADEAPADDAKTEEEAKAE